MKEAHDERRAFRGPRCAQTRSAAKVAVVHGKWRYSQRRPAERSWRLANALRSAGLAKGDRVATLLFNSPAMLEATRADHQAGEMTSVAGCS